MAIPTRDSLIAQVRADLSAEGASQVWIRRAFEYAVAVVLGGLMWAFYAWVDAISKQANPQTATGLFLDAWAAIYGLTRQTSAVATGTVVLTGTTGGVQPAGSVFVGPDGQTFTLDAETTLDGDPGGDGAAYPDVTATAAGVLYNLTAGTPLTVQSPAVGIDAASSVGTTGIVGGRAAETDSDIRVRLLERIRLPGEVGHERDYERWAKDASASVMRAWAYSCGRLGTEAGEVLVLFRVSGSNPIPSGELVTTVTNYIATKRPGGSQPVVQAPTGHSTPLTLALPEASNTTANKAVVVTYLQQAFDTLSPGTTLANIDLRAYAARSGFAVQFQAVDGGAGSADVVPGTNLTLCYLGTVTWGTWA